MAFVYHDEKVFGEIIHQRERRLADIPSVEIAGIVFDALAETYLVYHLYIVSGALLQPLRLEQLALFFENAHFVLKVMLDVRERGFCLFLRHHVMAGGENDGVFEFGNDLARNEFRLAYALHRIAEKLHPHDDFGIRRRKDVYRIPPHAEG